MWMHPEKYLVYSEVRNLTYTTHSPEETEKLGEAIAQRLSGGEVLALFGGMGMGKTALTRGLARGLGVEAGVSSPTFALVHEYHGRLPIYHFDMFRVDGWDDLYSTGFFDYLECGGVLVKTLKTPCRKTRCALRFRAVRRKTSGCSRSTD